MIKFAFSTWGRRVYPLLAAIGLCAMSLNMASAAAAKIYDESADARAEIQKALTMASKEHKRVILDFGGNWCGDCQVLDMYFHDPQNLPILESSFELVHVNVCKIDCNLDIAKQYGVDLTKGVPALAVLDARGRTIFSQKNGEFESMRTMQVSAVTEFLNRWK